MNSGPVLATAAHGKCSETAQHRQHRAAGLWHRGAARVRDVGNRKVEVALANRGVRRTDHDTESIESEKIEEPRCVIEWHACVVVSVGRIRDRGADRATTQLLRIPGRGVIESKLIRAIGQARACFRPPIDVGEITTKLSSVGAEVCAALRT
jgi:hypothetical protein